MKPHIIFLTVLLLSLTLNTSYADAPSSRPDWFQKPGAAWQNSERLSMGELMSRADTVKAFVQQQQAGAAKVSVSIVETVRTEADTDVRPLFQTFLTPYGYERAMSIFNEAIGRIDNPLHRARLHKIAADLCLPFVEHPR